jgi:hypothetical protein
MQWVPGKSRRRIFRARSQTGPLRLIPHTVPCAQLTEPAATCQDRFRPAERAKKRSPAAATRVEYRRRSRMRATARNAAVARAERRRIRKMRSAPGQGRRHRIYTTRVIGRSAGATLPGEPMRPRGTASLVGERPAIEGRAGQPEAFHAAPWTASIRLAAQKCRVSRCAREALPRASANARTRMCGPGGPGHPALRHGRHQSAWRRRNAGISR